MKKLLDKSKNTMNPHLLLSVLFILFSTFYPFNYAYSNTSLAYALKDTKAEVICELICPEDVSIFCNQDPNFKDDFGHLTTGEATLTNCEFGVNVTYEDSTVYYGPCTTPQMEIHRKWRALDVDSGKQDNCTQIISVEPWDTENLEFPEDVILFDLMECLDFQNQSHIIHPDKTGSLTLNGLPIFNPNTHCMIDVSVSDEYSFRCPESIEIIRTWKVQNLCFPISINNPIVHRQSIKISNEPGPLMINCPDDITTTVDPWGCTATIELPIPSNIQDLCGGVEFLAESLEGETLIFEGSVENDNLTVTALGLEPGIHHFQYMISDECDNVFECEFEVKVLEKTPILSLNPNVVIELTSSGTSGGELVIFYVSELDNGSGNPCGLSKLEIRREADLCDIPGNTTYNADGHTNDGDSDPNSPNYDPDGGEFITFCCSDLYNTLYDVNGDGNGEFGYIKVWVRLWDDSNNDNILGNEGDNYYEKWAFVKVEDKLSPAIVCPPDITVQCIDDFLNPDITGWAEGYSSCGSAPTEFTDIIVNLNSCDIGFIRKRWNVIGRSDIFCDQTVTVEAEVLNLAIDSEQQISYDHCPDPSEIPLPNIPISSCDVFDYTFTADTSYFEEGVCYKVIREYEFINWCAYEPNNPYWEETSDFSDGIAEITQIINISDENIPFIDKCEDFIVAVNDHEDEDNDGILCEAKIVLTNSALDPNSVYCSSNWLKWTVIVDLWNDGANDLEFSSFLPPWDDVFNDTNGNGIPDIYLKPTISEEEISIQLPDIEGDLSLHKVFWKVVDGCNNVTSCNVDFQVLDQTPPIPTCQDTSTVDISQVGPTTIWAIDYISDAIDYCTATENLRYTFSELAPEDDPLYDPNLRSSSRNINLNDIQNSPITLSIYTWDERGNFAICETVLIINTAPFTQKGTTIGIAQNDEILPFKIESVDGNYLKEVYANALYQNQPNPFRFNTTIQFDLAQDAQVKLTFINATNARTKEIEIDGKKGLNTYSLSSDLLSDQGLYYYRMTTKNHVETKKMILLH